MKLIKIKDNFYSIPTNWYDINLKQFLAIRSLKEKQNTESEIDYLLNFCSIITKISVEELGKLTPNELGEVLGVLYSISEEKIPVEKKVCFKINGISYVFDSDLSKITYGQFIDLDFLTKNKEFWEVEHRVCAIFIRPEKKSNYKAFKRLFKRNKNITSKDYLIEEYNYDSMEDRAKILFENLPMPYANAVADFFLNLGANLQNSTQAYSQK